MVGSETTTDLGPRGHALGRAAGAEKARQREVTPRRLEGWPGNWRGASGKVGLGRGWGL